MTLLPWPERPKINSSMNGEEYERYMHIGWHEYERARAEAALQRLRIAVEALISVSAEARAGYYDGPGLDRFVEIRGLAEETLSQIGAAPPA
jgi:hypothetical protein